MQKPETDMAIHDQGNLQRNMMAVDVCRTAVSGLSGMSAGVLGLEGLHGFLFYLIVSFVASGFLMLKVNFDAKTFFISTSAVAWDGILGGLFTFVLFWTLSFGLVHIF